MYAKIYVYEHWYTYFMKEKIAVTNEESEPYAQHFKRIFLK